jgi:hypothetical protein
MPMLHTTEYNVLAYVLRPRRNRHHAAKPADYHIEEIVNDVVCILFHVCLLLSTGYADAKRAQGEAFKEQQESQDAQANSHLSLHGIIRPLIFRDPFYTIRHRYYETSTTDRSLTMSPAAAGRKLVEMSEGDLEDIYTAALCSNGMADFVEISDIIASLECHLGQKLGPSVVPLETELWVGRKGMVFRYGTTLVVAFEATKEHDMEANAWSHGTDDDAWSLPTARYVDGRHVHAFYLDMWLGMREAALPAISDELEEIEKEGQVPSRLLVTGHSMGGGIST